MNCTFTYSFLFPSYQWKFSSLSVFLDSVRITGLSLNSDREMFSIENSVIVKITQLTFANNTVTSPTFKFMTVDGCATFNMTSSAISSNKFYRPAIIQSSEYAFFKFKNTHSVFIDNTSITDNSNKVIYYLKGVKISRFSSSTFTSNRNLTCIVTMNTFSESSTKEEVQVETGKLFLIDTSFINNTSTHGPLLLAGGFIHTDIEHSNFSANQVL